MDLIFFWYNLYSFQSVRLIMKKINFKILSHLSSAYLNLTSPFTFPNLILFYLTTKRFLRRSLIIATVVFVFNFKMLPPGQAHWLFWGVHSVTKNVSYQKKKKESDLYWSLEPEGVTMPHWGQAIPNLNIWNSVLEHTNLDVGGCGKKNAMVKC